MAEPVPYAVPRPPRQKVWVLNRHTSKEYREKYRDTEYVFPPNSEKKVIMDRVAAEKFLSIGTAPQDFDNAGNEISIGKPLYWQPLTDEEKAKFDPTPMDIKKEAEKMNKHCMICGQDLPSAKGLKIHTKRAHPEYEPVSE